MTPEFYHRANCRLCRGVHLTRVLELPPTPPANAFVPYRKVAEPQVCYPLDVYFCETCGHLQLLDVVEELLKGLNADNHALAVQIAKIPEEIRGYGHVKERHLEKARQKWEQLMFQWRQPKA